MIGALGVQLITEAGNLKSKSESDSRCFDFISSNKIMRSRLNFPIFVLQIKGYIGSSINKRSGHEIHLHFEK